MSAFYTPTQAEIQGTQLFQFIQYCESRFGMHCKHYHDFYQWTLDYRAEFWEALSQFSQIQWKEPYQSVLIDGESLLESRWFVGGQLNYAERCLEHPDDQIALIAYQENGNKKAFNFGELRQQVARLAAGMRASGVKSGDRIVGYLPNLPETLIAFLAAASLGAIWSSCSPDFGVQGVLDRFQQIEPNLLFAANGYQYQGKTYNGLEKISQIVEGLPTVQKIILVHSLKDIPIPTEIANKPSVSFEQFSQPSEKLEYLAVDFDHPIYILFSSGTTGAPKCIVHRTGGVLLQHLKELMLHSDLHAGDRLFYYTTCGWMMWNWMVSGLAVGATLVLYDGSPNFPQADRLFDLVERERITHFGTSAKFLASCEKAGVSTINSRDLSSLVTIFSTGSPLLPEQYDYVKTQIKSRVRLCSISGGTDIVSCFALGNPLLPIYPGELQSRGLALAVDIFDEQGHSVQGEKGELVCRKSFPVMPIGFWGDTDQTLYRKAYFQRFPDVWAHGDYAELTAHEGLIIYGRSDAVLNPGGVRIGTAEIYRQVDKIPEVLESIVIGQDWEQDVRIVLFVVLRPGLMLDESIKQKIKTIIRQGASPRHVPAKIIQVQSIPRTVSGKIVELAVRNIVHHRPVNNIEALANPEALDQFRDLAELSI